LSAAKSGSICRHDPFLSEISLQAISAEIGEGSPTAPPIPDFAALNPGYAPLDE
jgi:hypothetical protein